MPCLAPILVAAALAGPMCPRLDRPAPSAVMAALVGEAVPAAAPRDPAFEAAIRAIRQPAPTSRKRRHRR